MPSGPTERVICSALIRVFYLFIDRIHLFCLFCFGTTDRQAVMHASFIPDSKTHLFPPPLPPFVCLFAFYQFFFVPDSKEGARTDSG